MNRGTSRNPFILGYFRNLRVKFRAPFSFQSFKTAASTTRSMTGTIQFSVLEGFLNTFQVKFAKLISPILDLFLVHLGIFYLGTTQDESKLCEYSKFTD
jgi:hypothetical protein